MKLQGMRIIHHFSTLLALFSAISIPAQAIADLEPHLGQLTFTTGHKFGETLYQIGGAYSTNIGPGFQPFPTSELRFPLTLPTATIAFIQPIREKYTFAIRLETSYTTHSGLVKDSDWLTNPSVPDIYSESRSYGSFKEGGIEFNMRISKFRLPGELKLGCELDYMHYAYEIFDLAQTSNLPKYYTGVVSGAVGRYQVSYFIPYLQAKYDIFPKPTLKMQFTAALSPLVRGYDRDDHLLRGIVSTGKTQGISLKAGLDAVYQYTDNVDLYAHANYIYLTADGNQHSDVNPPEDGVSWADIQLHHQMTQYNLAAGVQYRF